MLARMKQQMAREYERFGAAKTLPANPSYDKSAANDWLKANPPYPVPAKTSTEDAFKAIGWSTK